MTSISAYKELQVTAVAAQSWVRSFEESPKLIISIINWRRQPIDKISKVSFVWWVLFLKLRSDYSSSVAAASRIRLLTEALLWVSFSKQSTSSCSKDCRMATRLNTTCVVDNLWTCVCFFLSCPKTVYSLSDIAQSKRWQRSVCTILLVCSAHCHFKSSFSFYETNSLLSSMRP